MNLKNRHKGNRKRQKKKRRERLKNLPPKQDVKFQLIDGNWSYYPVAECKCHSGFLTQGLMDTHRCMERKCSGLKVMSVEK